MSCIPFFGYEDGDYWNCLILIRNDRRPLRSPPKPALLSSIGLSLIHRPRADPRLKTSCTRHAEEALRFRHKTKILKGVYAVRTRPFIYGVLACLDNGPSVV